MTVSMTPCKSLSAENRFRFVCPIFGAEVEMRECNKLRDMVWRGQGPEVRKGCQACMSASKCPMGAVFKELDPDAGVDPYFSTTPKLGRLSDKVLRAIAPIVVPETTITNYPGILPQHLDRIRACNGLKGFDKFKGLEIATLEDIGYREIPEYPPEAKQGKKISRGIFSSPPPAEPAAETPSAAATGDLTAALNAAIKAST